MNAKSVAIIASVLPATVGLLHAAPRNSANYTISPDTIDTGGLRAASASYTNDGSITPVAGISEIAAPAEIAKHGYLGQLYDVLGFGFLASDYYPPELGSTQLIPVRSTDDGTYIPVPPLDVVWSILEGPVSTISPEGLTTTSEVYQNTEAIVRGELGAESADLTLYVQDVLPDNFGSYADDGIGDDWQILYFGVDNPLAAPGLDPDADGQTNLFEYIAGVIPNDPLSVFRLRIEPVPGEPAQRNLIFSPRLEDRTYTALAAESLDADDFAPLPDISITDNADERTLSDLDATSPSKFYRVEIVKP